MRINKVLKIILDVEAAIVILDGHGACGFDYQRKMKKMRKQSFGIYGSQFLMNVNPAKSEGAPVLYEINLFKTALEQLGSRGFLRMTVKSFCFY